MKIRPLSDRILVKRVAEQQKTAGGLHIPDSAKEKPLEATDRRGGQRQGAGGRLDPQAGPSRPATRSCSRSTPGSEIEIDGVEHLILREDDVLAVIE